MSFFRKWVSPAPQKTPEFNEKRSPTPTPLSGPERGLAILPNELIPTVLTRLDSRSLFCVAQVSRRFNELSTRDWLMRHGITPSQLSSGHAIINSDRPVEAFAALRIALFLRVRPLIGLTFIIPFVPDSQVISQLDSLISWFTPRLATTELDFGTDMIPHTMAKGTARALKNLVSHLSSASPVTVFVLKDGLFTCRPDALRRWNPETGHYESGWAGVGAETTSAHVRMHDGSRQRVPTIRTLQTLRVTYPLTTSPAPFNNWSLVCVDAGTLTDLQLTLKLAPHEWAAILDALTLPALVCVGLWAEAIGTATSTRFFNRHPKIRTVKHMATIDSADAGGALLLRLPRLESLNTTVPYLVHILAPPLPDASCTPSDAGPSLDADRDSSTHRFPSLAHIELRPSPASLLPTALLLASTLPALSALTLWSLNPAHLATEWPVFAGVRRLALCECHVVRAGFNDTTNGTNANGNGKGPLTALLAAFPALRRLDVNHAWAGHADISRRQVRAAQRALVEGVRAAHEGVTQVWIDGREWVDGG